MSKEKMSIESVYYRVYYKKDGTGFYTEAEHDIESAREQFKARRDEGNSDVKLVRVIEIEEIIAE